MKFNFRITLTTLGYITLTIIIAFLFSGVYTFFKVGEFSEDLAYENALHESKRHAETLKSFRGLYTSEVVAEVAKRNQMEITHDYKDIKYDSTGAIPLPATLSMLLAEKMTTGNTTVKLYSKYPFEWRKGRALTDFESRAFDYFEANRDSDSAYYEIDRENELINYAIPDKMVNMSCVNCHNNHPASPKVDWRLGDVRGAISIVKPVNSSRVTQAAGGTFLFLGVVATLVLIGLVVVIVRMRSVRNSIRSIGSVIEQLKEGDLPEVHTQVPANELNDVVQGLNILQDNFRRVARFADRVGKGELGADFNKLGDKDLLGKALIEMRNNLQRVSEDDAKRNWATAGLAQLGEKLRATDNGIDELYDKIISFVVKYTESNQGALFLLNNDNEQDEFLEMVACYAYDRKKYLNKRIGTSEGLPGQCYLEGQVTYITVVPKDYVKITSGLGDATPESLLLVPIKVNDKSHGVIELLSFNKFESYKIEFLQKAAENIASVISAAKINDRTRILLEQAHQQTEELRSQEEEMRQNMEELVATQEEMSRKEREYLHKLEELSNGSNRDWGV